MIDRVYIYIYIYFPTLPQVGYLVKTELLDAEKMSQDKDLVTSLRWMTVSMIFFFFSASFVLTRMMLQQERKPHPIYKAARKRGYNGSAVFVLVAFQFFYTACTLIPTYFLYKYYWLNALAIFMLAFICVWHGASYVVSSLLLY